MKRYALNAAIILSMALAANAEPIMKENSCAKKLMKMKGEKGPYNHAAKEPFPQGYFLVNANMPFLVGTILFHPQGDTLKLNKKQLDAVVALQKKTVPEAAKAAARIKKMELELAESALGKNSDLTKLDTLVDEIARAKAELTKAHLRCIAKVKKILSEEQYRHLLELAKAKK